jgi:electron transfer flavoprotein alpha subunit
VRFTAVVHGTAAGGRLQAAALGAFLRGGLTDSAADPSREPAAGETLVFYHDEREKDRLVQLAPTRDVRLVRTGPQRFEHMAALLGARAEGGQTDLFLFAGGPAGTELATRLACRSGGAVQTDVLSAETTPDRLSCRRYVYSGHLAGRFELSARPWCVGIAPSWADAGEPEAIEHVVLSDTDETGGEGPEPFADRELLEAPSTGDLAGSRFLVVAGGGVGSRQGVERVAAAARRMGAVFGVTRPVVMNAWAPMDRLIGVSGARTAPALCIVAGASGAPAFSWGIEKAGLIVAVDIDAQAPIVTEADLVLLDDAVAVLEELAAIVAAERRPR